MGGLEAGTANSRAHVGTEEPELSKRRAPGPWAEDGGSR